MDYGKLPWRSAAIVLWLADGEAPDVARHFNIEANLNPAPEAWWELGQAVIDVRATDRKHDKLPWIKVGETILRPEDILGAYEFFKNHGHGDA
jgi:hypothetical protein